MNLKKRAAIITTLATITAFTVGVNFSDKFNSNTGVTTALTSQSTVLAGEDSKAKASPVVSISRKVSPSVVAITTVSNSVDYFGRQYEGGATGSGIIIDSKGYIATNNHVIDGASNITVILSNGKKLTAKLVGKDEDTDLAVLKVESDNLTAAELGDSSNLELGELAVAIGSPMGTEYSGSVTSGIISGLNREMQVGDTTMKLIQTDAAINSGNSGGALVDYNGKVIGINTLKLSNSTTSLASSSEATIEGMGFAIPINEAKPILEQLIKNGKIQRPYLGIQGMEISSNDAKKYGMPVGVYIDSVVSGSGAESAGLKEGDIIVKVEDNKIESIDDLTKALKSYKIGQNVKVQVYNVDSKSNRTVNVELKEKQTNS